MPERLTITPTVSREERLLNGEDFLAMPCVVGHVEGMEHKHYTRADIARKAAREAVRVALEKLRAATRSAQEQAYSLRLDYEKNGDRTEAREMQEHIVAHSLTLDSIDMLLTQYQEPKQPKATT